MSVDVRFRVDGAQAGAGRPRDVLRTRSAGRARRGRADDGRALEWLRPRSRSPSCRRQRTRRGRSSANGVVTVERGAASTGAAVSHDRGAGHRPRNGPGELHGLLHLGHARPARRTARAPARLVARPARRTRRPRGLHARVDRVRRPGRRAARPASFVRARRRSRGDARVPGGGRIPPPRGRVRRRRDDGPRQRHGSLRGRRTRPTTASRGGRRRRTAPSGWSGSTMFDQHSDAAAALLEDDRFLRIGRDHRRRPPVRPRRARP